jgi:cytochrome oxidase assembly protein ShyY1
MRFPLIPTVIVAGAVGTMIALGVWQLGRAAEKDALRARYEQNRSLAPTALPSVGRVDGAMLYRRVTAFCLEPVSVRLVGGKSASGMTGTRHLAECRTGAEGPGFVADIGVSREPRAQTGWRGGEVSGILVEEPRGDSWFMRLGGKGMPARPMIVSDRAAPGLEPTAPPAPPKENSSRFYAAQWFFFAFAAALVYLLALRRRQNGAVEEREAGA